MGLLNLISLGVALLPTVVIFAIVLANARNKREPFKKVASVFTLSAISVIPAAILEGIGMGIIAGIMAVMGSGVDDLDEGGLAVYYAIQYVFVVGLAEEACKYFTFKWIIFHDREFDNTYDGVIYGAASALGFATLENLMYVFLDNDSPLYTAIMRAILSVPMHAVTGIVMGYYFGICKYRKYNNVNAETAPQRGAFIFSVILHGIYDWWVTTPEMFDDMNGTLEFVVLAIIMIFIYIMLGRTVHLAKKQTHAIYNAYYYEHLDGQLQDMMGGKTSDKKRPIFLGVPLPQMYGRGGFNPYNPYASMGMAPPPPGYAQTPYQPGYAQQLTQQGHPAQNRAVPVNTPQPPQYGGYSAPQTYPQAQQQAYHQSAQPAYGAPQQVQPQANPQMQQGYRPAQPVQNPYQQQGYQPQQGYPQQQNYQQPQQQYRQNYPAPTPAAAPVQPEFICSKCGASSKPGKNFCSICGGRIVSQRNNTSFS